MGHSTVDPPDEAVTPRILILSASPRDMDPLSINTEMREIQGELDRSPAGRVDYPCATRISSTLLRAKPTVLHFSGQTGHLRRG